MQAVIDGADYSGQELLLTGIALGTTEDGLVNVGDRIQPAYENFISVFDVPVRIVEGSRVTLRVLVEDCRVAVIRGKPFVLINTQFREYVR